MPPVSQAQRGLFRWAQAHPKQAAARGIKPSVAREFNEADPGGKLPEHKTGKNKNRRKTLYDHPRSKS